MYILYVVQSVSRGWSVRRGRGGMGWGEWGGEGEVGRDLGGIDVGAFYTCGARCGRFRGW